MLCPDLARFDHGASAGPGRRVEPHPDPIGVDQGQRLCGQPKGNSGVGIGLYTCINDSLIGVADAL
jgi:hypothetical protein